MTFELIANSIICFLVGIAVGMAVMVVLLIGPIKDSCKWCKKVWGK